MEKKSGRPITLIILVAATVVIAGCMFNPNGNIEESTGGKSSDKDNAPITECDRKFDKDRRDDCYLTTAEEKKQPELCVNIADDDKRERCYKGVAITKKDVTVCNQISDSNYMIKNDCYIKAALKGLDSKDCIKVNNTHFRYLCFNTIAEELNDASVCDPIVDDVARGICYSEGNGEWIRKSTCDELPDDPSKEMCYSTTYNCRNKNIKGREKAVCFTELAIESNQYSFCENIEDLDRRKMCYLSFATHTNNFTLCETYGDMEGGSPELKDDCYNLLLTGGRTNDTRICEKLEGIHRDVCYLQVVRNTLEQVLCKTMADEKLKTYCYNFAIPCRSHRYPSIELDRCIMENAIIVEDYFPCKFITDNETKDDCYLETGQKTKNPEACNEITDEGKKNRCFATAHPCDNKSMSSEEREICFLKLATLSRNYTFCENIGEMESRNNCYLKVAKKTGDTYPCGRIENTDGNDEAQENCLFQVAKSTKDPGICKRLRNADDCYFRLAVALKDTTICNRVQDQKIKKTCKNKLKN